MHLLISDASHNRWQANAHIGAFLSLTSPQAIKLRLLKKATVEGHVNDYICFTRDVASVLSKVYM